MDRRRPMLALVIAIALLATPLAAGAVTDTTPEPPSDAPSRPAAVPGADPCVDLFLDVSCGQAFFEEIGWLANNDVTMGFPDGSFRPTTVVPRQAVAVFLWRLAGSPAGPYPDPGFTDVGPGHPFFTAIAWMAANDYTDGFPDGSFGVLRPVTRQALAVFLWRLAGSPAGPYPDPGFTDVGPGHPFFTAIAWMAANDYTDGFPDGSFGAARSLVRQALAAFLFRDGPFGDVDVASAHRCEFLDPRHCLLPFPSNQFTRADDDSGAEPPSAATPLAGTSETGLRVHLDPDSMPSNSSGVPVDPSAFGGNDGFSPGQMVLAHVPGLDLDESDAPQITDLAAYLDGDSPVVIIDAATHERVPLFAELDANAAVDDDRALIVRPTVNFEEGHRYIVALRDLRDDAGDEIDSSTAFEVYRDDVFTGIPVIEQRRPPMEGIFDTLDAAGVARGDLYLAWDFTVASTENLSERLLHMRDESFDQLGADAPGFTVTAVDDDVNADIARRVRGTVAVPRYLEGDGSPGSRMHFGPDGMPMQNGVQAAKIDCIIPYAADGDTPARISLFGHGLLGDASSVLGFSKVAQESNTVFCGSDWIGLSSEDLPSAIAALADLSLFPTIPDRGQQGFLNFLFIGRAMKHADGFGQHPAFQDAEGDSVLDTSELLYIGGSQGGIMGCGLSAFGQDFTKSVLAVPGTNYSTMLRRSSNWPTFALVLDPSYPDDLEQTIGISMIQMLWDRGECNGYAAHVASDPYPDTPAKRVLLFEAFGDHQVANLATENLARTMGIRVRQPALGAGRSPLANQFWLLPAVAGYPYAGSALVTWDWGTPAPPAANIPPSAGADPHGNVGDDGEAVAQSMLAHFLDAGELIDVCAGLPCTSP